MNCNVFGPLILYEIIRHHVQFLHGGMSTVLIMLWEVWTPCKLIDFPGSLSYLPKSCISYASVAVITMPQPKATEGRVYFSLQLCRSSPCW